MAAFHIVNHQLKELNMPLVNSPEATQFMSFMATETGRNLLLGDRSKFNGVAINPIGFAQNALADAIPKFAALADDPTRTPVQQHDSARRLAIKVATVFSQSQVTLEELARELGNEGNQMITEAFALDPSRHAIQSEIRGWIMDRADKPDGSWQSGKRPRLIARLFRSYTARLIS